MNRIGIGWYERDSVPAIVIYLRGPAFGSALNSKHPSVAGPYGVDR